MFEKAREDANVKNSTSYLESAKYLPTPDNSDSYFRDTYEKHLNDKKPYNNMKGILSHHYIAG